MQDTSQLRITMADLLSHAWWAEGPTATAEEFKAKYKEVMTVCLKKNQIEYITYNAFCAEERWRNAQRSSTHGIPADFGKTHVFKPLTNSRGQKQLDNFLVEGKSPEGIFCYLFNLVSDLGEEVEISKTSWKINFEGVD